MSKYAIFVFGRSQLTDQGAGTCSGILIRYESLQDCHLVHIVGNVFCICFVIYCFPIIRYRALTEDIYFVLQRQGGQGQQQSAGFSTGRFFLPRKLMLILP